MRFHLTLSSLHILTSHLYLNPMLRVSISPALPSSRSNPRPQPRGGPHTNPSAKTSPNKWLASANPQPASAATMAKISPRASAMRLGAQRTPHLGRVPSLANKTYPCQRRAERGPGRVEPSLSPCRVGSSASPLLPSYLNVSTDENWTDSPSHLPTPFPTLTVESGRTDFKPISTTARGRVPFYLS